MKIIQKHIDQYGYTILGIPNCFNNGEISLSIVYTVGLTELLGIQELIMCGAFPLYIMQGILTSFANLLKADKSLINKDVITDICSFYEPNKPSVKRNLGIKDEDVVNINIKNVLKHINIKYGLNGYKLKQVFISDEKLIMPWNEKCDPEWVEKSMQIDLNKWEE
jgi:hypothetical protein